VANLALLVLYCLWDVMAYRAEEILDIRRDAIEVEPLRVRGSINLLWLLGVVACVALVDPSRPLAGWTPPPHAREGLLLALVAVSWLATPGNREIRRANDFSFYAILEVACLFIGIFICMQPPIEHLREEGARLGLRTPAQFFWVTGVFSSFLDNAPTYVVFFETAKALTATLVAGGGEGLAVVPVLGGVIARDLLFAISASAVFMGANTYIGNAPNFMVKSIAEAAGVKMPSFFGYMVYSAVILLPLFGILTVVFLR
jgi:Na+/H+ antiporter NhaD/arsenite permease-like protein